MEARHFIQRVRKACTHLRRRCVGQLFFDGIVCKHNHIGSRLDASRNIESLHVSGSVQKFSIANRPESSFFCGATRTRCPLLLSGATCSASARIASALIVRAPLTLLHSRALTERCTVNALVEKLFAALPSSRRPALLSLTCGVFPPALLIFIAES